MSTGCTKYKITEEKEKEKKQLSIKSLRVATSTH